MNQDIVKQNPDIPEDEWLLLSHSEKEFFNFIYEVVDYFDDVVRNKMHWKPEAIRISRGMNHIVISFSYLNEGYLYRVPIYGAKSLSLFQQADKLLGSNDFFPSPIYYDDLCMIEHYAEGGVLDSESPTSAFMRLAESLNVVHSYSGNGYGKLTAGNQARSKNIVEHYSDRFYTAIKALPDIFKEQDTLVKSILSFWDHKLINIRAPVVLCHGDLHRSNIIYDSVADKISIIDWESIGYFHPERDLLFLLSEHVTENQRSAFLSVYNRNVDMDLLAWYKITTEVIHFRDSFVERLIKAFSLFLKTNGLDLSLELSE